LKRFPSDAVSNCLLGQIALRESAPADAERLFQAALVANPDYKEALLGLGQAELALDHPEKALTPLRHAISVDGNYAQAHYQLGNALARLGHPEEAAEERARSAQIQDDQQKEYTQKLKSSAPHE